MRYAKLRFRPPEGASFHPIGEALANDPDVERGTIHKNELLDDGTGLLLAEARGDVDRYREILEESAYVIDYSVFESEGWWYSYTHFEQTPLTERMLARQTESELAMEGPIEVEADGSMIVTLVGPAEAFGADRATDLEEVDVELLEMGEHNPDVDDLYLALTERQREVLRAATDLGYYENPREATHDDVAEALDTSPSTIGEHLRKIESRVFEQLVRQSDTDGPTA